MPALQRDRILQLANLRRSWPRSRTNRNRQAKKCNNRTMVWTRSTSSCQATKVYQKLSRKFGFQLLGRWMVWEDLEGQNSHIHLRQLKRLQSLDDAMSPAEYHSPRNGPPWYLRRLGGNEQPTKLRLYNYLHPWDVHQTARTRCYRVSTGPHELCRRVGGHT